MIIKSMARKAPTFTQLIAYFGRDGGIGKEATFSRNLYHTGANARLVAKQFQENHQFLPERKNGNALYHEVIVLEYQPYLSKKQLSKILVQLADRYCERRAPNQLAWGKVHFDTEFPHIHLMLSANAIRSNKRYRLNRASFANIQVDLEQYKLQNFPELRGMPVYTRQSLCHNPKVTLNEGEAVRRTNKPSRKMQAFTLLEPIFQTATEQSALNARLMVSGFQLYQRGKTWGVLHQESGIRYRLTTLGLMPEFERILGRGSGDPNRQNNPAKTSTKHDPDPRAEQLIQNRKSIEKAARNQLEDFDRNHDEGLER